MANRAYSDAFKREAVALARVIGAEAASEQLGIGGRTTLRRWMDAAGVESDLPGDATTWERLRDLALARAEALVASGKLTPIQILTAAGIATRNADRAATRKPSDEHSAVDAQDAFLDWCFDTLPELQDDAMPEDDAAIAEYLELVEGAFHTLRVELLTRANAERVETYGTDVPTGHRAALLAWYSGKADVPADDVVEWCQQQTQQILAEHGSLTAFHRYAQAVKYRDDVIRQRADVLHTEGGMRLHEAIAFAREHLSDDLPIPAKGAA